MHHLNFEGFRTSVYLSHRHQLATAATGLRGLGTTTTGFIFVRDNFGTWLQQIEGNNIQWNNVIKVTLVNNDILCKRQFWDFGHCTVSDLFSYYGHLYLYSKQMQEGLYLQNFQTIAFSPTRMKKNINLLYGSKVQCCTKQVLIQEARNLRLFQIINRLIFLTSNLIDHSSY